MTIEELVGLVVEEGLASTRADMVPQTLKEIRQTVLDLVDKGYTHDNIETAICGMKNLWPFSDGQPWDQVDLWRNFTKAMAASGRKANRMPWRAREIPG